MDGERVEERYDQHLHPFLHHHHHPHYHTSTLADGGDGEAYQRLVWHRQHVLLELKVWVMVGLGVLLVLACVVYIVLQCRSRLPPAAQHPRGPGDDEKELLGSAESLESLIPADTGIRLKVRSDGEFFV